MTYSIIARDPDSGQMGVATQSNAFAVGSSVPWAMPGFGVIATQSMGEPMYGELGLDMLRSGLTASEALTGLRSVDPHPERRQVAMVDGRGGVDVYTGEECVAEAGHCVGENCVALANMMASDTVWNVMVETFEASSGALPERLMATLHAAEEEGGDIRGARSAAIIVVRARRSGRPWQDQVVDLRVDEHDDPVGELDRKVRFSRRYHDMVDAFELALEDEGDRAMEHVPDPPPGVDEPDLAMWYAIVLARADRADEARQLMAELHDDAPDLVETVRRFEDAGLVDPALLERILPDG